VCGKNAHTSGEDTSGTLRRTIDEVFYAETSQLFLDQELLSYRYSTYLVVIIIILNKRKLL